MNHYNEKELLALELAKALNDHDSYGQFLAFANRYPADLLRKKLARALSLPNIRNRAALFVSLVNNHDRSQAM
jgi:hypothetical protein